MTSNNWTQIGSSIYGDAAGNMTGNSVSISKNGEIVAIGISNSNNGGTRRGLVRIYQKVNNVWSQYGNDINGTTNFDYMGGSVSLSNDGNRVAVTVPGANANGSNSGKAQIYEYNNGSWIQLGFDITGSTSYDAGQAADTILHLSGDGQTIAIGALKHDSRKGHARVFRYENSNWTQLGSDLDGSSNNDEFGTTVKLSDNGNRLIVGAKSARGYARVFEYTNNVWTQLGSDIEGVGSSDNAAYADISGDGKRIALGAPMHDNDKGHVRIFELDNNTWTQIGSDIDGESNTDYSGRYLNLSYDGSVIAIAAMYNDANTGNTFGDNRGHVRVFYIDSKSSWVQLGNDIDGENVGDNFGSAVAITHHNNYVYLVASATRNDGSDGLSDGIGNVRMFEMSHIGGTTNNSSGGGSTSQNQTSSVCLLKGTKIKTDNHGDVPIEQLKKGMTIFGSEILGYTKGLYEGKLIEIKKDSFRKNCPSKDTFITPEHSILVNGNLMIADKLLPHVSGMEYVDNIPFIEREVYNVMCSKWQIMMANDVPVESLHPKFNKEKNTLYML